MPREGNERLMTEQLAMVLAALRIRAKLSQSAAGMKLRVFRSWITKVENGRTTPMIHSLVELAACYGAAGAWEILKLAAERCDGRPAQALSPISEPAVAPRYTREMVSRALGQTIRAAREKRGMTQAQLALKSTCCAASKISMVESGRHLPTLGFLLRMARALNTPAWNLVRCAELRLQGTHPDQQTEPQTQAA